MSPGNIKLSVSTVIPCKRPVSQLFRNFDLLILNIRTGKITPGVGILFGFFGPGAGVFHWKAVPETTEKISGPEVSTGDGY